MFCELVDRYFDINERKGNKYIALKYDKHKFKCNYRKFLANYHDVLKLKYDIDTMKRFSNTQFQ